MINAANHHKYFSHPQLCSQLLPLHGPLLQKTKQKNFGVGVGGGLIKATLPVEFLTTCAVVGNQHPCHTVQLFALYRYYC